MYPWSNNIESAMHKGEKILRSSPVSPGLRNRLLQDLQQAHPLKVRKRRLSGRKTALAGAACLAGYLGWLNLPPKLPAQTDLPPQPYPALTAMQNSLYDRAFTRIQYLSLIHRAAMVNLKHPAWEAGGLQFGADNAPLLQLMIRWQFHSESELRQLLQANAGVLALLKSAAAASLCSPSAALPALAISTRVNDAHAPAALNETEEAEGAPYGDDLLRLQEKLFIDEGRWGSAAEEQVLSKALQIHWNTLPYTGESRLFAQLLPHLTEKQAVRAASQLQNLLQYHYLLQNHLQKMRHRDLQRISLLYTKLWSNPAQISEMLGPPVVQTGRLSLLANIKLPLTYILYQLTHSRKTAVLQEKNYWKSVLRACKSGNVCLAMRLPLPSTLQPFYNYNIPASIYEYGMREEFVQKMMLQFALQAYRAKYGCYPARLNQLVPRYLAQLPSSLLAETGTPWNYQRANGGKKYLLQYPALNKKVQQCWQQRAGWSPLHYSLWQVVR